MNGAWKKGTRNGNARWAACGAALLVLCSCESAARHPPLDASRTRADGASLATPDPARPEDRARIARLQKARAVVSETVPRLSPDGSSVLLVATHEGAPRLYLQDLRAGGPARPVAAVPPRYRRPVYSPDGSHVYFTSDASGGGDEAFEIRRLSLATGTIDDVAVGGGLKREGPWLVASGQRLYFTARPGAARGTVLMSQSTAAGATATTVLVHDGSWLHDVRADGDQALLVGLPLSDSLMVADLPNGAPRRLFPPATRSAATRIYAACYSPDGARIYVATDDGGERSHVIALDARTGRELARHVEARVPGGDLQGLVVRGQRVAFVVDLGTHHEVRVLDADTLAVRASPSLPLGSEVPGSAHPTRTSSLSLSADGARLALEWSSPSSPPRVFVVDTTTGETRPATTSNRPATTAVSAEVVRVRSFDELEIPMLVYGASGATRRPVVVSVHGGFPFAATARYDATVSTLVSEGYVVVEPNVRGSGGFGSAYQRLDDGARKLDGVRDFRAVGQYVSRQPWADPRRIAIMGPSAGGYYTLMALAHQPELWRGGIAIVPLYDVEMSIRAMDGDLRAFIQRELAPLSEPALLAAISPSTYVDRIRAPLFVYGAGNDVRTPRAQIDALVTARRRRGGRVEYMLAADQGHARADARTNAEMIARVLRFLDEVM